MHKLHHRVAMNSLARLVDFIIMHKIFVYKISRSCMIMHKNLVKNADPRAAFKILS